MALRRATLSKQLVGEVDPVYRLASHLCAGPEEAEQLVEETYQLAFNCVETLDPSRLRPRLCLFKILHKLMAVRWPAQEDDALADINIDDQTDVSYHANQSRFPDVVRPGVDEHVDRMKMALESLSWRNRAIIFLWAVEELTFGEIAEITGVPSDTVRSQLRHAFGDIVTHCDARSLAG